MTVDAGRIKLVGRSFVRSLGHYDVNEIQHRARQLCTSFTPAQHPPAPCLPTHLHWPSTCSACPAVHLPPPPPSPSPTTANVGSFAWRPRATPSPFSAFHLLPLCFPFPSLFPPFSPLHLSGCTFRFNFVAIMHAKVQCFVGILFTQPPLRPPFALPPPLLVGILLRVSYSSVSSVPLTPFLTQRQLK